MRPNNQSLNSEQLLCRSAEHCNISFEADLWNWGFSEPSPRGRNIRINPNWVRGDERYFLPAAVVHEVHEAVSIFNGAGYATAHPAAVVYAEDAALAGMRFETRTSRSAGCNVFDHTAPLTLFGPWQVPLCTR